MKTNIHKILLGLIIILALVLRMYQISSYPALNADEAAIGYNAYSLIETGKDEHGNSWPIHFQSFNDYKPGLYFYIALPFVYFNGLNTLSVRLPGVLMGVFSVLLLYLFIKEYFKDERLALISSLMLAISPWHIHFSRGGWEVNAATFLILLGLYLFVKGIGKSRMWLVSLSMLSFVASLYTYHSARIIVPLLVFGLFIFFRKEMRKKAKAIIVILLVGLVLLLPLVKDFTGPAGVSRASGVSIIADKGTISQINEQRGEHISVNGFEAQIFHNKAVNYGFVFANNWLKHYWGEFLFLSGDDIQRNKVPETGQMYLFDIIFVLAGLYFIARKPNKWGFIIYWLIVAPIAAALTFQSPHALRAHNMVVPLVVISANGLLGIYDVLKAKKKKYLIYAGTTIIVLAMVWNFTHYLRMYWLHMAKQYPYSSQYGVEELVGYVNYVEGCYKNIVVTTRYDQPYILFLFYSQYPPNIFQKEHELTERDEYGFSTVNRFGKYVFQAIDYSEVLSDYPNSLVAGTQEEILVDGHVIAFPNGDPAFIITETN